MTIRPISHLLEDLSAQLTSDQILVSDILNAFHERGFGFVLFIIALPMALPLPVPPGINVLLATPLILLTAQQAIGRRTIWLPDRIQSRSLSRDKLQKLITGATPWLKKLEILIKPRLGFITQGAFSNIIGVLGLIMALSVCIPLPLTNTVPSLGIALMAVGVIMRDGLAVIAGALIGTAWVAMLALALIFLGSEGIDMIREIIKSVL